MLLLYILLVFLEELLKLAGTREASRSTDEIIDDIYGSRVTSTRFEALDGIFDRY